MVIGDPITKATMQQITRAATPITQLVTVNNASYRSNEFVPITLTPGYITHHTEQEARAQWRQDLRSGSQLQGTVD